MLDTHHHICICRVSDTRYAVMWLATYSLPINIQAIYGNMVIKAAPANIEPH